MQLALYCFDWSEFHVPTSFLIPKVVYILLKFHRDFTIFEFVLRGGRRGRETFVKDLFLLDFSKTFDKVSQLRLLYKLRTHGIEGTIRRWIRPRGYETFFMLNSIEHEI